MVKPVLTLGSVVFRDMEIPEQISFGGRQRVAVQNLLGGGRYVEVLGSDDGTIRFSGIFTGDDAVSRAQSLDMQRIEGDPLPLFWDKFYYTVVVEKFEAEYRKTNFIPFSVVCVVADNALMAITTQVANLVASDLGVAGGYSGQAGILVAAPYAPVQAQIGSAIASSGAALGSAVSSFNGTTETDSAVMALGSMVSNSAQLAAQTALNGYVNRAAVNLASALP